MPVANSTALLALSDGSVLWIVHHTGSYPDMDNRGSGNVPIDVHSLVLAKDADEAKMKASSLPSVIEATERAGEAVKVAAAIVTDTLLVVARDSSNDPQGGWRSPGSLHQIALSHPEDVGWKLAACLVPAE